MKQIRIALNPLHSSKNKPTIVFRCAGNLQTGLGHISRSLGLAEALVEANCECLFLGRFDEAMEKRLEFAGMRSKLLEADSWSRKDATALTNIAVKAGALGVVIDSYLLGAEYLEHVQLSRIPALVIDDFAELPHYPCAAVLNFTCRAAALSYPRDIGRAFLGPAWFPARRNLRVLRARGSRPGDHVRKVLVAAGGSDAYDFVTPVLDSLLACDRALSVHVVVTTAQAVRPALLAQLAMFDGESLVVSELPDLAGELSHADLCISGAGLTKYEAAYVGVPAGVLSQNFGQAKDAARFAELGLAVDLGPASQIDPQRLTKQLKRLLTDRVQRQSLQRRGLAMFPLDPAHDLCVALLAEVFRRA
jgi:spore coat polysaccharide biosynthesis predicted glycosyltransferase SpsG